MGKGAEEEKIDVPANEYFTSTPLPDNDHNMATF
jgi:hypothetical protein